MVRSAFGLDSLVPSANDHKSTTDDAVEWSLEDFRDLGKPLAVVESRPLRQRLRASVGAVLGRAGYDLRRHRPRPALRQPLDHPIAAMERAGFGPFIMDVPIDRLRVTHNFGVLRRDGYPMVEMAHRLAEGADRAEALLPLESYYASWRPATRAEAYGIPREEASHTVANVPPWNPVMPWTGTDVLGFARSMAKSNRDETAAYGQPLGMDEGHVAAGGPWSRAKLDIEFRRVTTLMESIRRHGFRPDALLTGILILDGDDWAVMVRAGQHRSAVAEAMGLPTLPFMFEPEFPPVRRSDARHWRAVRAGLFTETQALTLFDRMMSGEPPPGCPHPGSPERLGWQPVRGNVSAQGS